MHPANRATRCLTIDVEDYFHIEAAYGCIDRQTWPALPPRVERNVDLLLDLLHRRQIHGTFFILGDVARRHPQLAPRIAAAGHEIACHGDQHDRLHRLDPDALRDDLLACKHLLEDQTGRPVVGYRAPTFSLVEETAWALDVLLEAGFEYDSSIFPVRHPAYGVPHAPDRPFLVTPHVTSASRLLEVPPLTWSFAKRRWPVAGGGYFRLLPLWFVQRGLEQAAAQSRPAVLYFHPWEFDPGMPRMDLRWHHRVRTYTGLHRAAARLEKILAPAANWMRMIDAAPRFRHEAQSRAPFALSRLPVTIRDVAPAPAPQDLQAA